MTSAHEVVRAMCDAYERAVNASDSDAYGRLFTPDAIRIPPGSELERGPEEIAKGEQASYDDYQLSIRSTPIDVVELGDRWIYALADVEGQAVVRADGSGSSFRATKAWLLHQLPTGEWRLARHMWNTRP
ncbi:MULTISPECIES: YybH family protein [Nocardioides]|uniref:YybH family protein n=1 Tax=Nocardioides vastitatis TaxID=2568655 RepID=A0ABW0ZRN7_9ACTN|nr:SgcJ/EcaC family oxidoreductase [Nocardioides sp.]THJ07464.1 SgcJ/EcaC family oxidoreductase [Nocardioides sp.]